MISPPLSINDALWRSSRLTLPADRRFVSVWRDAAVCLLGRLRHCGLCALARFQSADSGARDPAPGLAADARHGPRAAPHVRDADSRECPRRNGLLARKAWGRRLGSLHEPARGGSAPATSPCGRPAAARRSCCGAQPPDCWPTWRRSRSGEGASWRAWEPSRSAPSATGGPSPPCLTACAGCWLVWRVGCSGFAGLPGKEIPAGERPDDPGGDRRHRHA